VVRSSIADCLQSFCAGRDGRKGRQKLDVVVWPQSRKNIIEHIDIAPRRLMTKYGICRSPIRGFVFVFARMAALETCSSLRAPGKALIARPLEDVVPSQDPITQKRAKAHQACQTRDNRPSRTHSSKREKRLDALMGDLVAANVRSSLATMSNSVSSKLNATERAIAASQNR
jgi:hypothetical protein